jgi:rubredoxin
LGGAFRKYECQVCGYVYDEATGDPQHGVPAGTRWADVPDDWGCPDCGVTKATFAPVGG